jgi:branched-chain amino acid transport system substrate-binding protein
VNATGGVDGHPIQVIVKDDANVASKSLAAVQELVEKDHVVAIVAQHESGLEAVWEKYVDSKGIPVIGGTSTGAEFLSDPNFYPVTNDPVNTLFATFLGASLSKVTSTSAVYCAELPACANVVTLAKALAGPLKLTFSGSLPISGSATSYTSQCLSLKSKGAASVFVATAQATAIRFIANCKSNGYDPLFLSNPQAWSQDQLTNSVWDKVLFTSDAPLWFGDGPGTADYLAAMQKYEPKSPLNSSGTSGWYAGQVFGLAVQKSGATGDFTPADITKGMHSLGANFDLGGIIAPVTYTAGKPVVQQSCGWFMTVVGGKETAPLGTKRICAPAAPAS